MKRREFIGTLAGGLALGIPSLSTAHSANKPYRVGRFQYFPLDREDLWKPGDNAWLEGMRALGYREGDNFIIQRVSMDGRPELIEERAAQLVQLKPDVIHTTGVELPLALRKASSTVPIVVAGAHDGIKAGLWDSLSHPGGNITGVETLAPDLDIKHIELAKEILPKIKKLVVLYNPEDPTWPVHQESCKLGAEKIGVDLRPVGAKSADDFETSFELIAEYKPDALITIDHVLFSGRPKDVGALLVKHGIPSIHEFSVWMPFGGLASYGSNANSVWRRTAYFVDRILKGANPADLPVELPDVYELAINLKRAKELGITMPVSLISRANIVIEISD